MWYIVKLIRECMEMNLEHLGIPPLYVGANVGYSWYDGKEDELEAPVLLMDKKGKEIQEMLDKGVSVEDLPYYNDPRNQFYEDIREFMCEVIVEEITKNNYKTLDDCHGSQRLMSYSGKYMESNKETGNKHINALFQSVLDGLTDSDKLYQQLRTIEQGEDIEFIPHVEETEIINTEDLEIIEDNISINKKVLKMIQVDNENKEVNLILDKFIPGLTSRILSMLITKDIFSYFKPGSRFYKINIILEGSKITLYGKYFPVFFSKVLQKLLTEYYIYGDKGDYTKFDSMIDEVGTKNLKN